MSALHPDSYVLLARRYERRVTAGQTVYEQGAVPTHFFVVISGRIAFEVVDATGARRVVREALPGESVGVVAAFSERPTSASSVAAEDSVLLAVPVDQSVDAFRASPELALRMIEELAAQGGRRKREAPTADHLSEPVLSAPGSEAVPGSGSPPPVAIGIDEPLAGAYNDEWFFIDDTECPVCGVSFEYLRVRTGAVRPVSRDSDFRIAYRTVDPTFYAVVVCPQCRYAAYLDDFELVGERERRELRAAEEQRTPLAPASLCGERSLDGAALSLELARLCYAVRDGSSRRQAGLLHRLAWLERSRGDVAAETALLEQARDAYCRAFERDGDLTDVAALRAAYLIGDLAFRLGDHQEAARWLLSCTRMPESKQQAGILRMARDRLADAREALAAQARRTA